MLLVKCDILNSDTAICRKEKQILTHLYPIWMIYTEILKVGHKHSKQHAVATLGNVGESLIQ